MAILKSYPNKIIHSLSMKRLSLGKNFLSITMVIVLLSNISITNAEPFYLLPNLMSQVRAQVKTKNKIQEKIDFLDSTYKKMESLENANKKSILEDLKNFKRNLIYSNLNEYTQNKYFTGTSVDDMIKQNRRYYQAVKIRDLAADIHPNYLNFLEKKIKEKPSLDEGSSIYKVYIYVLYLYQKNKNIIKETTESRLTSMGNFGNSNEYITNIDLYKNKFEKLQILEKINTLSKTDFTRIYSKIASQKISPGSDYMKGFLYWYATYKKFLGSNSVILNAKLNHSKQIYTLSCEANSARDVINYYNSKSSSSLISEDMFLNNLPSFTGALIVDGSGSYLWEDPSRVFVGQVTGKQSSNPNKFTGYGVYADPIVATMNKYLLPKKLIASKSTINEKAIFESLLNEHPIVFWYLTPVVKGKGLAYETKPTVWKTPSGKTINGYLGEHTGVLVGIDITKEGKIENIYYYEGKKEALQKMQYQTFLQTTGFFNEMIVVNEI